MRGKNGPLKSAEDERKQRTFQSREIMPKERSVFAKHYREITKRERKGGGKPLTIYQEGGFELRKRLREKKLH